MDKDPEAPFLEMSYHAGCRLVILDMEPCCDKIDSRISTPIRHVVIGRLLSTEIPQPLQNIGA